MSSDETSLSTRAHQINPDSDDDLNVSTRLLFTYSSSGVVCALMLAINIGMYHSIPETEPKIMQQIESSFFLAAAIVLLMATYGCYLQLTTLCALKEEEDMMEFQQEWGQGPWRLFNLATVLFLCGLIMDSYIRHGYITFIACCAFGVGALFFWIRIISRFKEFLSGKEQQF